MPGVYITTKKDGSASYRSSITYKSKHISLASFSVEAEAERCYHEASLLIEDNPPSFDQLVGIYEKNVFKSLPFSKAVSICNFRDNGIYFSNPIYLRKKFFDYYLGIHEILKFDIDDLFYYSSHRIQKRGGHLFVEDYGMQLTLGSRYGIRPYSVEGRDYVHINGDSRDYRYNNIEVYNQYAGVRLEPDRSGPNKYKAYIHVSGYYTIGYYSTVVEAAIAYNKAAKILNSRGLEKKYTLNYIEGMKSGTYKVLFDTIKVSQTIYSFVPNMVPPPAT